MKKKFLKLFIVLFTILCSIQIVKAQEYIMPGYQIKSLKEQLKDLQLNEIYLGSSKGLIGYGKKYECSLGVDHLCSSYYIDYNGNYTKNYNLYNAEYEYEPTIYYYFDLINGKMNYCQYNDDICTVIPGTSNIDVFYDNESENLYTNNVIITKSGDKYGVVNQNSTILEPSENFTLVNGTYYSYVSDEDDEQDYYVTTFPILYNNVDDNYVVFFNDGKNETISSSIINTVFENATEFKYLNVIQQNDENKTNYYTLFYSVTDLNTDEASNKYILFTNETIINNDLKSNDIFFKDNLLVYYFRNFKNDTIELYNAFNNNKIENDDCYYEIEGSNFIIVCNHDITIYNMYNGTKVLSYNPWDKFGYLNTDKYRYISKLNDNYLLVFEDKDNYLFGDIYSSNETFTNSSIVVMQDYYKEYVDNLKLELKNETIIDTYFAAQLFYFFTPYYDDSTDEPTYNLYLDEDKLNKKYDHYKIYRYTFDDMKLEGVYEFSLKDDYYVTNINSIYSWNYLYALVGYNDKTIVEKNETIAENNDTSNSTSDNNPETGAVISFVSVGLLITLGVGITLYKRKKSLFKI